MRAMRVLTLEGAPRAMGRAFGETCRDAIRAFFELRVRNAILQAKDYGGRTVTPAQVVEAARRCVEPTRAWDPAGFEELTGVAEGAGMTVEQILALNGLTDLRDLLSWGDLPEAAEDAFGGCTAFIAQGDVTADERLLCAQTWDLATDNLPYVLAVHRRPSAGPETWSLTTVGCLSLIGLNAHGIAVGTTNIRTLDTRPGVTYLSLIHKALGQRDLEAAVAAIADAPRAGAHFYFVADGEGRAVALECSARRHTRVDVERGFYGHTNHCLVEANVAVQGHAPRGSSLARYERLNELLATWAGRLDVDGARAVLSDRANGSLAIRRDDFDGINTNGAVIMVPEEGRILACHGLPDEAAWVDLKAAGGHRSEAGPSPSQR